MKTFSIVFFAALLAGSSLISLPSGKIFSKNDLASVSTAIENTDTVIVPVTVSTSFSTKYPNATKIRWYQYAPDKIAVDPAEWYYGLDDKDYYVSFYWEDADYMAWYDNGNWIHASKNIDDIDIPADVMKAVNSQYPGYEIVDVDMEFDAKQSLYEVKLMKGDSRWNVHYSPTGSVVRKKEKRLNKSDPQTEMTADFQTRFPNATEVTWYSYQPSDRVDVMPTDWDYSLDASDHEVRFKMDGSEYQAWYDNGKWVRSELVTMADVSKLPANINNAIRSQYSGYTIKDVETEQNSTRIIYEVELAKGNEKCKVHYTGEGAIIKKKCRTV